MASASLRLSASELLNDHFLCIDESESKTKENYCDHPHYSNDYFSHNNVNQCAYYHGDETVDSNGAEVFEFQGGNHEEAEEYDDDKKSFDSVHISITGKRRDNGDGPFLRLRIADKEGL